LVLNISFGQSVVIKNNNAPFTKVTLAYSYGKSIFSLKEAILDEKGFAYLFNESLHSGMYHIIFADSSTYEFLYDSFFPGRIEITYNNNEASIKGPELTAAYAEFLRKTSLLSTTKSNKSLYPATSKSKEYDSIIRYYRGLYPQSLLDAYLKAQTRTIVPDYIPPPGTVFSDSANWAYQLKYFQKHCADNVDWNDSRLIYTPIYTATIDFYLDKATRQQPVEIFDHIQQLVNRTQKHSFCEKFILEYLLAQYESRKNNPVYEWVYIAIIEHYFLNSYAWWISNDGLKILTSEYNRIQPSILFQAAPSFTLTDQQGTPVSLADLPQKLCILYFYNYDCSICTKVTPELQKITSRYDYLDLQVVAICLGEDSEKWKTYVNGGKIRNWINLFNPPENYQLALHYNLSITPTLFLLGADKTILSKNFTISQLEHILFEMATNENK
jgi:hypothetical protein